MNQPTLGTNVPKPGDLRVVPTFHWRIGEGDEVIERYTYGIERNNGRTWVLLAERFNSEDAATVWMITTCMERSA